MSLKKTFIISEAQTGVYDNPALANTTNQVTKLIGRMVRDIKGAYYRDDAANIVRKTAQQVDQILEQYAQQLLNTGKSREG